MNNVLRVLLITICWIFFPPVFVFLIFKNKTLQRRTKIWSYLSVILSPFTICIIGLIVLLILFHQPSKFSIDKMEETLQIEIKDDYDVEKNTINYFGQDYNAIIELKLSDKALKNITNKIEKSPFFNLKHDFHGNNEIEWQKSDTVLYWKVRDYLKKEHLTGYWIKKDDFTYDFYSPNLSDISNSAILFDEAFEINATISLKDKTLNYEYIKF